MATICITGANRGIGFELSRQYRERGDHVVAVCRSGSTELEADGAEVVSGIDVADSAAVNQLADRLEGRRIDILINNAGILRDKSFKNMTLDEWDAVINVHLNGSAYVTWHAWPIMYQKNYGRILFTSSVSGILGSFGQANYGAAKMGMLGLMNNLSREGASHNVHVNCLSPGAETRMTASVPGADMNPDDPSPENHPKLVSPAAIYLVSEDAPNGRVIQAARGRFASDAVFANAGVKLGLDATWEDVAEHAEEILDYDSMRVKTSMWRD